YARTYLDRSSLFRTVKTTPYWVVYGANTPPAATVTSAPGDLRPRATWVAPDHLHVEWEPAAPAGDLALDFTEYPSRRAHGPGGPLYPTHRDELGLLHVSLPAGARELDLVFEETAPQQVGRLITVVGGPVLALLLAAAIARPLVGRRQKPR